MSQAAVWPRKIGPLTLEHPFILAPMAGITNSPFRRLMRRLGSSVVVSELVSSNGIEYAGAKTLDLLRYHEEERPVGLQIFGDDDDSLCRAAQHVERQGADFVDLNLGCPVPKVVKRGAGSAMCRDPIRLGQTLSKMVRAVKIPVTIKIRTGWDQESRNALDVIQAAHDAGVLWVAIHGRTRAQGYSGQSDWDFIAEVKSKSPLPILGNGDLNTPELALRRWKESGCDAVLIGRGALRNPFIFEQARALWSGKSYRGPTPERYIEVIETLKGLLIETFGERGAMIHARKFLSWYATGFPGCHEFRKKVFSIAESDTLWREVIRFFADSAKHQDSRALDQPFLMGGHG